MSDWRNRLPELVKDQGTTLKELSIRIGRDPGYLSKMLNSIPNPSIDVCNRIAEALGISLDELVNGRPREPALVTMASVRGEIAAGAWMDAEVWDERRYDDVPVVPKKYPTLVQSAWFVQGSSMDLEGIVDGCFVITVPYHQARGQLIDGDIVLVEEIRDGLIRRTCKEISVTPDHVELVPHSSNPNHQTIRIPRDSAPSENIQVAVTGLVIGTYMPIGRAARRR